MVCAKHNVFYVVGWIETIEIYFKINFLNSLITAKHNCQFSFSVMNNFAVFWAYVVHGSNSNY